MFFLLSKTLNYLTMPLVVVCILLLLSGMLRSGIWKKRLFRLGLGLLLLWSNDFASNEFMKLWEIPATPYHQLSKTYEWAIVLTGVTKGEMDPNDRVYFQRGADRVVHTVQLYKKGLVKKVLVSGGSGRLIDIGEREANDLAQAMVLMGVNQDDIRIEADSRNTHESAVAASNLLKATSTPQDCLLVTSAFHMRRAAACFKQQGWEVDTFSTDFLTHRRTFTLDVLLIPKIDALVAWHHLLKETTGYLVYLVAGYI